MVIECIHVNKLLGTDVKIIGYNLKSYRPVHFGLYMTVAHLNWIKLNLLNYIHFYSLHGILLKINGNSQLIATFQMHAMYSVCIARLLSYIGAFA